MTLPKDPDLAKYERSGDYHPDDPEYSDEEQDVKHKVEATFTRTVYVEVRPPVGAPFVRARLEEKLGVDEEDIEDLSFKVVQERYPSKQ